MKHFMTWTVFLALTLSFPLAAEAGGGAAAATGPLPPPSTPAPANINTYLHSEVNNLTKAMPPVIRDRKVLMTFQGDQQPRYVAAAFAHESWRVKHLFYKNQNNVYFLVYDLAADSPATLDYRLIVDGLWQADSTNKNRIRNDQGVVLSRVAVAASDLPHKHTPEQGYNGEVEFRYQGKSGQQIALVGNFNNWDPFSNFLEEEQPGVYAIRMSLPLGTILYQFVSGTRTFLDPLNAHTGHDAEGATFSIFENVKKTKPLLHESTVPTSGAGAHG